MGINEHSHKVVLFSKELMKMKIQAPGTILPSLYDPHSESSNFQSKEVERVRIGQALLYGG